MVHKPAKALIASEHPHILDDAPRKIDDPVLVDLLHMKYYAIGSMNPGKWALAEFTGLPLTDYPLIITDRKALG